MTNAAEYVTTSCGVQSTRKNYLPWEAAAGGLLIRMLTDYSASHYILYNVCIADLKNRQIWFDLLSARKKWIQ
jgi:hypothetical protein